MLAELRARGRAAATLRYATQKAGHLLRVLGDATPLVRVDARSVDAYVETRRHETASAHTIAKELGILRQTLRIARRRGEFAADPRAVLPLGFAPEYEPRTRRLSEDELARLLDALEPNRAAWVAFAVATGARLGEVVRARREDVDMASRRVHLRGTKTAAAVRDVPVTALSAPLLARALRDADGRRGPLFSPWQNVRRDIARACARCVPTIAAVTPNDLRRTHAGWLRSRGVDAATVADLLGHADLAMVRRVYGRLTVAELGETIGASLDRHENRHSDRQSDARDATQRPVGVGDSRCAD